VLGSNPLALSVEGLWALTSLSNEIYGNSSKFSYDVILPVNGAQDLQENFLWGCNISWVIKENWTELLCTFTLELWKVFELSCFALSLLSFGRCFLIDSITVQTGIQTSWVPQADKPNLANQKLSINWLCQTISYVVAIGINKGCVNWCV